MGVIFQHAWLQLGAIGLLVLFLFLLLYVLWKHHTKLMKCHKEECWGYTEKVTEAFKESSKQQIETASVLSELSTLIKALNGRAMRQ